MKRYVVDSTDIDKRWFAAHPDAECLLRPMLPGEFPFLSLSGERHVLVTRVCTGIRQKHPLKLYCEHNGIPAELMFADTGERWHVGPTGRVTPMGSTKRQAWQALLPEESRDLVKIGRHMDGGAK